MHVGILGRMSGNDYEMISGNENTIEFIGDLSVADISITKGEQLGC